MGKAALKLNVPRIKLKYRGVVVLKYIYILERGMSTFLF